MSFQEVGVLKKHLVYRSRMTASHTKSPQDKQMCSRNP